MIRELEEIKRIFLQEWDPIGIRAIPEAADEYDAYAFRVFTSLNSGATVASLKEYLDWLETEHMGLSVSSGRSADIANKVFALHKRETET